MDTPLSYAAHLASYIASPLKIEKLVAIEFDKVPPLHEIAELRYKVEREHKAFRRPAFVKDKEAGDGEHFAVRSLLRAPAPRTYPNSRTIYIPAHVEVSADFHAELTVRCHRDLITASGKAFNLTYEDVIGPVRRTRHVCARTVAARLLRDRGNSFPQIGRFLGGRDHSTAINLCANFDVRARRFPQIQEVYDRLSEAMAA